MKISGFTIARNIEKYSYPYKEAILSVLPICDEFIVNVGNSEDNTLELIRGIAPDKIRIVTGEWDDSKGKEMLSVETNFAMSHCRGDWAFYVQLDEVVHEKDLKVLKGYMTKYLGDPGVDAFRFKWLHFYGSYYRYRIDPPWYQKQDRIVRNNGTVESYGDAWAFRKKDGTELRTVKTPCFIYHYGWVNPPGLMARKRRNAENIGFARLGDNERKEEYDFGDPGRFPVYFGTHPAVMSGKVLAHAPSREDRRNIIKRYFWSPFLWFGVRYKTFLRGKKSIPV
ncbi:MAG: glycosyltransferase [Candidatus Omnitrophica bacterium]|nr:glycosyltransferase [Candidatus Omnitrophota bacterium]MDD5488795.1 glycosyltransferase [Candidatus Omnitrophota bacterium]